MLSESDGGAISFGSKDTGACSVDDVLQLLRILYAIATDVSPGGKSTIFICIFEECVLMMSIW